MNYQSDLELIADAIANFFQDFESLMATLTKWSFEDNTVLMSREQVRALLKTLIDDGHAEAFRDDGEKLVEVSATEALEDPMALYLISASGKQHFFGTVAR